MVLLSFFMAMSLVAQNQIDVTLVEGGNFMMGSNNEAYKEEQPVHNVKIPSFYMAQYEISYDQYLIFTKVAGYPEPYGTPGMPLVNVTWQKAVLFCNWLSVREQLEIAYEVTNSSEDNFEVNCSFTKSGYRLPTEAEWEFAARGGIYSKSYKFSGSNFPYNVAWFSENYKGLEHKSGEKLPNEVGVYDMSGNVAEFCWDYYSGTYYSESSEYHPKGSRTKFDKVYRGGTRRSKMKYIEVFRRFRIPDNEKNMYVGIRVVRTKTD